MSQWRSQDLILGGGAVKITCEGAKRRSPSERSERGGGGVWRGVSPSHSESFLQFDVVNGAIWCICQVFSTYSTNLYLILLWKWLKGGSFTCIHATLFSFFSLSLSPPPFFCIFFWGGGRPPPPPPLATRLPCQERPRVGASRFWPCSFVWCLWNQP